MRSRRARHCTRHQEFRSGRSWARPKWVRKELAERQSTRTAWTGRATMASEIFTAVRVRAPRRAPPRCAAVVHEVLKPRFSPLSVQPPALPSNSASRPSPTCKGCGWKHPAAQIPRRHNSRDPQFGEPLRLRIPVNTVDCSWVILLSSDHRLEMSTEPGAVHVPFLGVHQNWTIRDLLNSVTLLFKGFDPLNTRIESRKYFAPLSLFSLCEYKNPCP